MQIIEKNYVLKEVEIDPFRYRHEFHDKNGQYICNLQFESMSFNVTPEKFFACELTLEEASQTAARLNKLNMKYYKIEHK